MLIGLPFITVITDKVLFPPFNMNVHVHIQITFASVCLFTNFTNDFFHPCMAVLVRLEFRSFFEMLAAYVTPKIREIISSFATMLLHSGNICIYCSCGGFRCCCKCFSIWVTLPYFLLQQIR